mmetsp:Transcript_5275/g.9432  ORF Transcript_5275/g.9432 Transcript_5275/m.9432 type:complete len:93 (-) Transcript_5275:363-641(-)
MQVKDAGGPVTDRQMGLIRDVGNVAISVEGVQVTLFWAQEDPQANSPVGHERVSIEDKATRQKLTEGAPVPWPQRALRTPAVVPDSVKELGV